MYKTLPVEDYEQEQARLRKHQREMANQGVYLVDRDELPVLAIAREIEEKFEKIEEKKIIKKPKDIEKKRMKGRK